MKRSKVYKLIDGERDYQDGHNHPDGGRSVADWAVFMQAHLAKCMTRIYYLDEEGALDQMRKMAALAVACMEHNETKPR